MRMVAKQQKVRWQKVRKERVYGAVKKKIKKWSDEEDEKPWDYLPSGLLHWQLRQILQEDEEIEL